MNAWLPFPVLPLGSLWSAFVISGLMGQTIVLGQLALSIVVWSIMVGKWQELHTMTLIGRRFRKIFDSTHGVLEIYLQQRRSDNPMVMIYQAACEKLIRGLGAEANANSGLRELPAGRTFSAQELVLVKGSTEQTLAEQLVRV